MGQSVVVLAFTIEIVNAYSVKYHMNPVQIL